MKQNIHNHHLEKLDQMVCIVPAGVGSNLGAVVAVANQKGQNPDLFSYMRPQIHSVSCSDFCGESSCGGLASRLAFVVPLHLHVKGILPTSAAFTFAETTLDLLFLFWAGFFGKFPKKVKPSLEYAVFLILHSHLGAIA